MEALYISLILLGTLVVIGGVVLLAARSSSKRIAGLHAWAARHGFAVSDQVSSELPRRFSALNVMRMGIKRDWIHTMRGKLDARKAGEFPCIVSDLMYDSGVHRGRFLSLTFLLTDLPWSTPVELRIKRKGALVTVGDAKGFEQIELPHAAFMRAYALHAKGDADAAGWVERILTPDVIDVLLAHQNLRPRVELASTALARSSPPSLISGSSSWLIWSRICQISQSNSRQRRRPTDRLRCKARAILQWTDRSACPTIHLIANRFMRRSYGTLSPTILWHHRVRRRDHLLWLASAEEAPRKSAGVVAG